MPSVNLGGGLHTSSSPSLDLGGDTQPFPPPLDLGGTSKPPDDDSLFAGQSCSIKRNQSLLNWALGQLKFKVHQLEVSAS